MAFKRKPYNWARVQAGDIISFKYKPAGNKLQTIVVLNPKLPVVSGGKKTFQLIGIQLKKQNKIGLRITRSIVQLFDKVGKFKLRDKENSIYQLEMDRRFILSPIKGSKQNSWNILGNHSNVEAKYRTYDWMAAKRSVVFLPPLQIFTTLDEDKDKDKTAKKVKEEPKKVKEKPKKPKESKQIGEKQKARTEANLEKLAKQGAITKKDIPKLEKKHGKEVVEKARKSTNKIESNLKSLAKDGIVTRDDIPMLEKKHGKKIVGSVVDEITKKAIKDMPPPDKKGKK